MTILFLFLSTSLFAQRSQRTQQINEKLQDIFLDTLTNWQDITNKAQKENKFIYLFATTSFYSSNGHTYETQFFPTSVQSFLKKHFILLNLQVRHEHKNEFVYTYADNRFLDSLYKAQNIYNIPANIIFNQHGVPITKFLFSFEDTTYFIKYLKDILKGENQYYTLLKIYKTGNRKPQFIRKFYSAYKGAVTYFDEDTIRVFRDFINAYPGKSIFTKANGQLLYDYSEILYDECSRHLFLNRQEWYRIFGKQKVDNKIIELLVQDFELTTLLKHNYADKKKRFEKTKEDFLNKRSEYKEYHDIVFAKAHNKLTNE